MLTSVILFGMFASGNITFRYKYSYSTWNKNLLIFGSGSFSLRKESFGSFHCGDVMLHQNRGIMWQCLSVNVFSWNLDMLRNPHIERRELVHSCVKKAANVLCHGHHLPCSAVFLFLLTNPFRSNYAGSHINEDFIPQCMKWRHRTYRGVERGISTL